LGATIDLLSPPVSRDQSFELLTTEPAGAHHAGGAGVSGVRVDDGDEERLRGDSRQSEPSRLLEGEVLHAITRFEMCAVAAHPRTA
jgi:hypothetical protein